MLLFEGCFNPPGFHEVEQISFGYSEAMSQSVSGQFARVDEVEYFVIVNLQYFRDLFRC